MDKDTQNLNKNNLSRQDGVNWKPVIVFYVKTTSWIVIPLALGILGGKYVRSLIDSQTLFFVFIMLGFGITCFGIYREIKQYKIDLEKEKNGNK